ncbi:MAG: transcriptional regulator [Hyphomicrobiaceae bacterium]
MLHGREIDTIPANNCHSLDAMRDPDIQRLIDATAAAFASRMTPGSPIAALHQNIFGALADDVGTPRADGPETQPVCRYLAPALVTAATGSTETAAVADAVSHLGPRLQWRPRAPTANAQEGFVENHANTLFVGSGGLEDRDDVRIGASLVAPNTRYPDHDHPPEEMYLILSPGAWRNADTDWTEPGIGGLFHNTPGIEHAMRAGDAPLLAIWCLWSPPDA